LCARLREHDCVDASPRTCLASTGAP
jgi:hypothetical protein